MPRIGANKKVFFLSSGRLKHKQPQIYELNTASLKERRLTYQDGSIHDFVLHDKSNLIYFASSTDEDKENPLRVFNTNLDRKAIGYAPPTTIVDENYESLQIGYELYSLKTSPFSIERITNHEGVDFEVATNPTSNQMAFVRFSSNGYQLMESDRNGSQVRKVTEGPDSRRPSYSRDGQTLYWVTHNQIWKMDLKRRTPVKVVEGYFNLSSVAETLDKNGLVFSGTPTDYDQHELFHFSFDSQTVTRLTYSDFDEIDPQISVDGQQIIFSSDSSGKYQIQSMKFTQIEDPQQKTNL